MKKPLTALLLSIFTGMALAASPVLKQPTPLDVQTPGAEPMGRDVLAPSRIQELPLEEAKALLKSTEGDAWKPYAVTGLDDIKKSSKSGARHKKVRTPMEKDRESASTSSENPTLNKEIKPVGEGASDKKAESTTGAVKPKSATVSKKKSLKRKKKLRHAPKSTLYKAATVSITTAPVDAAKVVKLPQ